MRIAEAKREESAAEAADAAPVVESAAVVAAEPEELALEKKEAPAAPVCAHDAEVPAGFRNLSPKGEVEIACRKESLCRTRR